MKILIKIFKNENFNLILDAIKMVKLGYLHFFIWKTGISSGFVHVQKGKEKDFPNQRRIISEMKRLYDFYEENIYFFGNFQTYIYDGYRVETTTETYESLFLKLKAKN